MLMDIMNFITKMLWSSATPALIIAVGVYFTIRTRFVQVRRIKDMCGLIYKNSGKTKEGISGLQSFMISVSGRVGVGNVAGVATAICFGGPGSIPWMCLTAIIGGATSFIECTLSQIYKIRFGNKEFRGGTCYYIEKGIGLRWLAIIFAVCAFAGECFGFHLPNIKTIVTSVDMTLGIKPLIPTIFIAITFALLVFGGVKRIGTFSDKAVPFMSFVYITMCLVVIVLNFSKIPGAIALMLNCAFNPKSFLGGMLGTAVSWGVKRGLYSNEAGQGSATVSAGASDVEHPAQEGFTQSLAVYFDTLLICLIGAVTIIVTESYNVVDPLGNMVVAHVPDLEYGVSYVQNGITNTIGGIGSYIMTICVLFFCFTSIVAMHYYGEVNLVYIFKKHTKQAAIAARLMSVFAIFVGGLYYSEFAWGMADVALGIMTFINLPIIFILGRNALAALKDYEEQKKAGVTKFTFDPEKLGIKGTEPNLWKELSNRD